MYIPREQALSMCNVVIISNSNYCPLIWLFRNKSANKKIDHAHKRALRISIDCIGISREKMCEI